MPDFTFKNLNAEEYVNTFKALNVAGQIMEGIPEQDNLNANITDPRPAANQCLFDLFVMANYGVAFKDIPKLSLNQLPGHNRSIYFEEFKKFVHETPLKTTDEFGKEILHPENAKKWGEMLNKANKKISEYKIPNINLSDMKQVNEIKEEMAYLGKIGTELVQVGQRLDDKLNNPQLNKGFVEGFGSVANMNKFRMNIYTLQDIITLTFRKCSQARPDGEPIDPLQRTAYKYFCEKNQKLYGGKTLEEFNKAYPKHTALGTIESTPFSLKRYDDKMPLEDKKAIQDYLQGNKPLPEKMKKEIEESITFMEDGFYTGSAGHDVQSELEEKSRKETLDKYMKPLMKDGKAPEVKDMTKEQKEAAIEGFDGYFTPAYAFYFATTAMVAAGKDQFDLIKIGDKSAREFCAQKYNEDRIFGQNTEFAKLSVPQQEEYMKLSVMRAMSDPAAEVTCYDVVAGQNGTIEETKTAFSSKAFHEELQKKQNAEPEHVTRNKKRVADMKAVSDELYNLMNEVDYNLFGKGSDQFDEMKKEIKALKKFTDEKYKTDKNGNFYLITEEELLDAQYKALTKIKAYLDYKQDQFDREPNRRNDPKRQKREQPRIKNSIKMLSKLECEYLENKKYVMGLENDLRKLFSQKLDEAGKERLNPDTSYPANIKKSVDLIFALDGKNWEGKEDGKAVDYLKKITSSMNLKYDPERIKAIGMDENHPGRDIIQKALKDEIPRYENGKFGKKTLIEAKTYDNKELISMAVKEKGIKLKVDWPSVKSREQHNIEVNDYRKNLWSQQTKAALDHTELYNDQDNALVASKQPKDKLPDGPVLR